MDRAKCMIPLIDWPSACSSNDNDDTEIFSKK